MKGIWESSAYSSVVASNKPRTVLMVNANATPNDIKFDPGVRSKVSVVATPPDRLSHVHKLAKTKNLVKGAKGDHPYLPSVLGFGKYHNIYVAKGWQLIGPSGHGTKCPLLIALFLFLLSFRRVTFLAEGVIIGSQNFAWGFNSKKNQIGCPVGCF